MRLKLMHWITGGRGLAAERIMSGAGTGRQQEKHRAGRSRA